MRAATSSYLLRCLFIAIGKLEGKAMRYAANAAQPQRLVMLEVAAKLNDAWHIMSDNGLVE